MTTLVTDAHNATLPDLVTILQTQRARQIDLVVPGAQLSMSGGNLIVPGTAVSMDETGVTPAGGHYRSMRSFDSTLADKLGVPIKWVRWTRENRTDIYDMTINLMFHGSADGEHDPDARKYLLRLFKGDNELGIARALLSDTYKPIDHLDVLMTALSVVNEARDTAVREALGMEPGTPVSPDDTKMAGELGGLAAGVEVSNIQLTEDTMRVRVIAPGITGHAPILTKGYRDPFRRGGAERAPGYQPTSGRMKKGDIVQAGFDLVNNEVGGGAFSIVPMFRVCICSNGQTSPGHAIRTVHLGGKLEEGQINWSDNTQQKAAELVMAKTRDAMTTFCTPGHLETLIAEAEERAAVPIGDPAAVIKVVAKKCSFSDEQANEILKHFTLGGQLTAGGIANAVTSVAQTAATATETIALEDQSLAALGHAADAATAAAKKTTAATT
jgi:hypothetical protein